MASRHPDGLALIFSIFLGLMVATLIGVGVYTFYPPRDREIREEIRELRAEQVQLRDREATAEVEANADRLRALEDQRREVEEDWARVSSIVLILLATLVMALSLMRAGGWPVISNGLLLGGVFSMLYGTGWSVASGDSWLRFFVILFALAVTLGLGWLRFVRGAPAVTARVAAADGELVQRLEQVEGRLDAVRRALEDR